MSLSSAQNFCVDCVYGKICPPIGNVLVCMAFSVMILVAIDNVLSRWEAFPFYSHSVLDLYIWESMPFRLEPSRFCITLSVYILYIKGGVPFNLEASLSSMA